MHYGLVLRWPELARSLTSGLLPTQNTAHNAKSVQDTVRNAKSVVHPLTLQKSHTQKKRVTKSMGKICHTVPRQHKTFCNQPRATPNQNVAGVPGFQGRRKKKKKKKSWEDHGNESGYSCYILTKEKAEKRKQTHAERFVQVPVMVVGILYIGTDNVSDSSAYA